MCLASLFQVDGSTVFYSDVFSSNVLYISHLLSGCAGREATRVSWLSNQSVALDLVMTPKLPKDPLTMLFSPAGTAT